MVGSGFDGLERFDELAQWSAANAGHESGIGLGGDVSVRRLYSSHRQYMAPTVIPAKAGTQ